MFSLSSQGLGFVKEGGGDALGLVEGRILPARLEGAIVACSGRGAGGLGCRIGVWCL